MSKDLQEMQDKIAAIQAKERAIKEENRRKAPQMANAIDVLRANGFPNALYMGRLVEGAVLWPHQLPLDSKYWKDVAKTEAEARDKKPKRGRAVAIRKRR